jgi:hypothetical protein
MIESPVERLSKTNPDLEIWWDSSPLVYETWVTNMLQKAAPAKRPILLDPRLFTETEQMVADAEELSALSPNVMIKVPASMQGVEVVKVLTSKSNSTLEAFSKGFTGLEGFVAERMAIAAGQAQPV